MVLLEPMKKQPHDVISFPAPVILLIIGLTANGLIISVHHVEWFKRREILVFDKVVYFLAVSRICFQSTTMLYVCKTIFAEDPLKPSVLYFILDFCMCLFNFTNLWFLTLLSVLFFLKIANYSHALFLRLKILLSQKILVFVMSILLLSLGKVLLFMWNDYNEGILLKNSTRASRNETWNPMMKKSKLVTFILGNCGPLIIYWSSVALLLVSLCRHMRQMRSADKCFTASSLDGYYVAIKSLVACFFLYGFHVGSNLFVVICYLSLNVNVVNVLLNAFPTVHSALLIYRTPRLKQPFFNILQCGTKCLNRKAEHGVHI